MANAGRVAIVPKGDYSSSTAYKRLDLVRYNEKAYVAKKANTGVAPTNTEYWMLMTSDGIAIDTALSDTSTNPVQNKVVKTAIDNIQTTSGRTFQPQGWYRIAYRDGNSQIYNNSCFIALKKSSSKSESHLIRLEATSSGARFSIVSSKVDDTSYHAMTKIRYTYDSSKTYIEVYAYHGSATYGFTATLFDMLNAYGTPWKKLDFEDTSETVDGVTVTTTYDIPANARPVTDLDLAKFNGTENLTTSVLEKALELPNGIWTYHLGGAGYVGNDIPAGHNLEYGMATIEKRGDRSLTVTIRSESGYVALNGYDGTVWTGWNIFATTADLANYLPKTGGNVYGNVNAVADDTTARQMNVMNSLRRVYQEVSTNGVWGVYDGTNGKVLIISSADGATNTFNGTATGNLPLNGGGTVESVSNMVMGINSTSATTQTLFEFLKSGVTKGYLGFNGENPIFMTANGLTAHKLHHDGNSAKVAIQSTAPTDTTSLWVDTANNKVKAYKDGAWTAMA